MLEIVKSNETQNRAKSKAQVLDEAELVRHMNSTTWPPRLLIAYWRPLPTLWLGRLHKVKPPAELVQPLLTPNAIWLPREKTDLGLQCLRWNPIDIHRFKNVITTSD